MEGGNKSSACMKRLTAGRRMEGGNKSSACMKKLTADLKRMEEDAPSGVSGAPREDNIMLWDAIIFGPPETIWDDGIFKLTLEFGEDYPITPPKVRFVSNMFHPNVYNHGGICLDILRNQWSPAYGVAAVLISIQSLLCDPNPNSAANPEAAKLYFSDVKEYTRRVRQVVEESLSDV